MEKVWLSRQENTKRWSSHGSQHCAKEEGGPEVASAAGGWKGSVTRPLLVTRVEGFARDRSQSQKARVEGPWKVSRWRQHFVKGKEDQRWGWKERGCGHVGLSGEETPFLWKWQDRDKGPTERCGHSGLVTEAIKRKMLPIFCLLTGVGGRVQTASVGVLRSRF